MTDATYIAGYARDTKGESKRVELPAPDPVAVPVFIHDCATPVAGETLLSLLMKRMMRDDQP